MGMISEFKEFAMRGNVIDLAVGVIIGGIVLFGCPFPVAEGAGCRNR